MTAFRIEWWAARCCRLSACMFVLDGYGGSVVECFSIHHGREFVVRVFVERTDECSVNLHAYETERDAGGH